MKLAFDFGITNTDVVSYKDGEMKFFSMPSETINNNFLDKLLLNAEIELKDIDAIAVTGGKSSDLEDTFKTIPIVKVNEVEAIGYGAKDLYNISESNYLVVSCGTGTACVASIDNEFHHMGGISVGGGTLQGLSNLILGEENAEKINTLAVEGDKDKLDSLIGEVVNDIGSLHPEITASNFAKGRYKWKKDVDWLVDDSPENWHNWKKGRGDDNGFILMDMPYNQHIKVTHRIKELKEVKDIIG